MIVTAWPSAAYLASVPAQPDSGSSGCPPTHTTLRARAALDPASAGSGSALAARIAGPTAIDCCTKCRRVRSGFFIDLPQAGRPTSGAGPRGPTRSLIVLSQLVQRTGEPAHRCLIARVHSQRAHEKAPSTLEVTAREQHRAQLAQRQYVPRLELHGTCRFIERAGQVAAFARQPREIDVRQRARGELDRGRRKLRNGVCGLALLPELHAAPKRRVLLRRRTARPHLLHSELARIAREQQDEHGGHRPAGAPRTLA